MIPSRLLLFAALWLLIALSADIASADIYRYKDKDGVWHFTNDQQRISSDRRYKLYIKYHNNPKLYIDDYAVEINKAAEQYGIESSLIKAVIHAESAFDHRATSREGAKGLMQLMPYTADYLSVGDPYDPEDNILGGTKYLSMLMKRFNNNTKFALAAYNAGPEIVDRYNGVPPFEETKNFVEKVMKYYNRYKSGVN